MKPRSVNTHNPLLDLAARPAVSGGFKKLQRQQTPQCRRLERFEGAMIVGSDS